MHYVGSVDVGERHSFGKETFRQEIVFPISPDTWTRERVCEVADTARRSGYGAKIYPDLLHVAIYYNGKLSDLLHAIGVL